MKVIIVPMIALLAGAPAAADKTRPIAAGAVAGIVVASTRLDGCRVAGGGAAVSGKLFVQWGADQRLAPGDGVDLDVSTSDTGGAPTISAHAINTKGTGATNKGRVAEPQPQVCAADPGGAKAGRAAAVAAAPASCTVDEAEGGATVMFRVPLAAFGTSEKTFKGHVTLLKRGDDAGGAKVVAQCSSTKPSSASWDLATLKK